MGLDPKYRKGADQRGLEFVRFHDRTILKVSSNYNAAFAAKFHFVDYAPPSLVLFRDQIYLQLTLRNPALFDRNMTSNYRRAAQSFDLFLAPLLKDLLTKIPATREISSLDITVLDRHHRQPVKRAPHVAGDSAQ